jgi:hypothetical protein
MSRGPWTKEDGVPQLARLAARRAFPIHSEGFVLDVIPSQTDAQPETPTTQDIDLGCLLSDDARLPLRRDQNTGGQTDGLSDRGQKAKGTKVSWKGSFSL